LTDSTIEQSKETEQERIIIQYKEREAIAYVASRMPATYAAIYNVLRELSRRIDSFKPSTVMDFGTGPGTAIWAANEIWGDHITHYMGIDISEAMLQHAERLLDGK
jgi:ribosomal protein RSM22 (predicted rRNA methylase)